MNRIFEVDTVERLMKDIGELTKGDFLQMEKFTNGSRYEGIIEIDGKGKFRYTLEPVHLEGTINIPPAETPRPAPPAQNEGATYTVMLVAHEMKTGTVKNGKRAG